ncbi:PRELI domain-containing protein 1, mitochondrial-like isoform X3 [Colossoma macropomum]|uniref:PRELI domain-containing protein 1, mitochondrial-like isoform X3 n=1 Tax=Colossoma macropomum TaxID=42526 RepID=UPI0018647F05|nr:PRELI domain-containing protein 1, mitochondrial-like isoform X3 [Colossoma macropomum]
MKYFFSETNIKSSWDQVFSAFWQRYPNPFSTHVLTEDVVYRSVTADHRLITRRLLTKTNRLPRWAERFFPTNLSRSVYILEDSVVDPVSKSLSTYTWNLNHTTLMEFGLARFKSNQMKAMKGLEYALAKLHGDGQQWPLRASVREASEKAKEAALAATETAKHLASAATPQKLRQYV